MKRTECMLSEEQYYEQFRDTNTNNLIRFECKVDGQLFWACEKNINTQREFYQFQTDVMERIEQTQLTRLARFVS